MRAPEAARPRLLSVHAAAWTTGSGKSWLLLLRALRGSFELWTCTPAPFPSPEIDRDRETVIACRQISRRPLGNLLYLLSFPLDVARFILLIRRQRIGMVHCNSFFIWQPMVAARLSGCRLIVHVREAAEKYPRPLYAAWVLAARLLAHKLIFVSKADMRHFPPERAAYLPNWIDPAEVDRELAQGPDRAPPPGQAGADDLLVVSQLIRGKGQDFAIEVLRELLRRRPVRLILAGGTNGNANNERYARGLAETCRSLGLESRVIFLGEVARPAALMRRCRMVLMPSPAESFSRVHLEAMAAGCVLAATDAGSTLELIRDGENGLVIRHGDAAGAARKIERALADPSLLRRLGEAARRTVAESFGADRLAPQAAALFLEAARA